MGLVRTPLPFHPTWKGGEAQVRGGDARQQRLGRLLGVGGVLAAQCPPLGALAGARRLRCGQAGGPHLGAEAVGGLGHLLIQDVLRQSSSQSVDSCSTVILYYK